MKKKVYKAMGLMSGTSMDGVDVSIIESDGNYEYSTILDKYFIYNHDLYEKLTKLRDRISSIESLEQHSKELNIIEREITLFHANIVNQVLKFSKIEIDFIGFHGQTIFHNPNIKITKQLGDGNLLSKLTKKIVVNDFRQNDLNNGGQGAPLTPIFHNVIVNKINNKHNIGYPIGILNIGGISNITNNLDENSIKKELMCAYDIGPGNCLIDEWIRKNSNKKYDENGSVAKFGNIDNLILNQALENFDISSYDKSLDIKDFSISFVKGLSLENGAATLIDFTASLIAKGLNYSIEKDKSNFYKYLICGGGRKNQYLIDVIKKKIKRSNKISLEIIDKYGIDGDFVESQAFAYLAIRSYLKLPISFPGTTRCKIPSTGGVISKNF
jgi:anhydro-N-acetylmuramic acid kinase